MTAYLNGILCFYKADIAVSHKNWNSLSALKRGSECGSPEKKAASVAETIVHVMCHIRWILANLQQNVNDSVPHMTIANCIHCRNTGKENKFGKKEICDTFLDLQRNK